MPTGKYTKSKTAQFTIEQYKEMEAYLKLKDWSYSWFARHLVKEHMKEHCKKDG